MITPFRTESEFIRAEFIRAQMIRWQFQTIPARRDLIRTLICSVVVIGMGLLVQLSENKFNPFLIVGYVFGGITLLIFYGHIQGKRNFRKAIHKVADHYERINLTHAFEFSEETVKYTDTEKSLEFHWTVFSSYSIYKNYLILAADDTFFPVFMFENNSADKETYERILEIIEEKVEFKKIK